MEDIFGDRFGEAEEDKEDEVEEITNEKPEEETRRVVQPKVRTRQPRPKLDVPKLTGNHGIGALESMCKDITFKGKGHELRDLNVIMGHLEHWAHRLNPKMTFDDCIDKIEDMGSKKQVMTYLTKLRLGMEECEVNANEGNSLNPEHDPFDDLLNQV